MSSFVHFVSLLVPTITDNTSFMGIFRSLSGLEVYFDVLEYSEGGNNDFVHHLPGRVHYPNLVAVVGDDHRSAADSSGSSRPHVQAELPGDRRDSARAEGRHHRRMFAGSSSPTRIPVRWSGPTLAADSPDAWSETLEIAHSGLKLSLRCRFPQGFQRAKLEIDGGDTIECAFNPQSYTISKTNVWTYKPTQGTDLPKPEFGGGMPMSYKLSLLLDASLEGPDKSVKDQANQLMQAMHGGGSAPKFITFSWGSVKLPEGGADVDLDPVRAVSSQRRADAGVRRPRARPGRAADPAGKAQNPTTRGIAGLRSHTVRDGDSLPRSRTRPTAMPTRWRAIAEANGIDDPLRLRRGSRLTIPRLDA